MESVNVVELSGSIVDVYTSSDYLAVTLSIKKYAGMAKGEQNIKDYPRIVWYGEEAANLSGAYAKYDYVNITATVESSLINKGGKPVRKQSFVGKNIERAKTKCENSFGVKPDVGDFTEYINTVRLRGTVIQCFTPDDSPEYAKFVMKVAGNKSFSYPEIVCYGHIAEYVRSNLAADVPVSIIGTVQTYVKSLENGDRDHRMSIVCREIAIHKNEK